MGLRPSPQPSGEASPSRKKSRRGSLGYHLPRKSTALASRHSPGWEAATRYRRERQSRYVLLPRDSGLRGPNNPFFQPRLPKGMRHTHLMVIETCARHTGTASGRRFGLARIAGAWNSARHSTQKNERAISLARPRPLCSDFRRSGSGPDHNACRPESLGTHEPRPQFPRSSMTTLAAKVFHCHPFPVAWTESRCRFSEMTVTPLSPSGRSLFR